MTMEIIKPLAEARKLMAKNVLIRKGSQSQIEATEDQVFGFLRKVMLDRINFKLVEPRCCILEDQIVWARSPVRLDLAGGWSDTPPYCLENGGKVVNLAVDINDQPPVQVFARLCSEPFIVINSIDLGTREIVKTWEELSAFNIPGNSFALAKAALCLAGLSPKYSNQKHLTLRDQLKAFGNGIELSLLAAVPKGSGLGTSSILASTILASLSRLFGNNWDNHAIFCRAMALEQMITTGGGWQDQAGGMFRGFKMIETLPGLEQKPVVRWLPKDLFSGTYANRLVLLYYTGITRLAKNILAEIVRKIFINSQKHLKIIGEIVDNASMAYDAAQRSDYQALAKTVAKSWVLNQQIDKGTNTAEVQSILSSISDYLLGAKLLGAGGGGYMLLFSKDEEAGIRIRQRLHECPPNKRARFVNFSVSDTGLVVTES